MRQWFHQLKHFCEPDCYSRQEADVNETKIEINGGEHCIWAVVDYEMFKVLAVEVTSRRLSFDALPFFVRPSTTGNLKSYNSTAN